jgi:hypothetical protein
MNIFMKAAKSGFVASFLSGYRWYRKFHGGRWELWWIPICASAIWLEIHHDLPDDYRQPCSEGPRIAREDW